MAEHAGVSCHQVTQIWKAADLRPHGIRSERPSTLTHRCQHMVSYLGLGFWAIDFALKPDGTYVFLEINPNGEWLWLEDQLGLPISDRELPSEGV